MTLTSQDYIEIEQLYYAYSFAIDLGDGEGRKATFTPDGEFRSSYSNHESESIDAIAARTAATGNIGRRHLLMNIQITVTEDGADGRCYTLILLEQQMENGLAGLKGFYFDKLVKTENGWRFKSREVWMDDEEYSPYRGKQ